MSKKYVIDLPDDAQYILINGASENHCYTRMEQVDDLEELNSDYINEHYGELQDEAYQAGMDKAWELANDVLYDRGNILDILGCDTSTRALDGFTPREIIEKLEAYEKSDRIEVGDEVEWDGDKYVVTYLNYNFETSEIADYDLLAYDGSVIDHVKKCVFTKTGKHYDIQSILEAMRE